MSRLEASKCLNVQGRARMKMEMGLYLFTCLELFEQAVAWQAVYAVHLGWCPFPGRLALKDKQQRGFHLAQECRATGTAHSSSLVQRVSTL